MTTKTISLDTSADLAFVCVAGFYIGFKIIFPVGTDLTGTNWKLVISEAPNGDKPKLTFNIGEGITVVNLRELHFYKSDLQNNLSVGDKWYGLRQIVADDSIPYLKGPFYVKPFPR